MMKYLRLGYRNIVSHKRRAFLTIFMIVTVVAITLVLEGIMAGSREGWLISVIHSETGHIQITRRGYREKYMMSPLDLLLTSPDEIEKEINTNNDIIAITKRLNFGGMIATKDKTAMFSGIGIDPVNEYDIFDLIRLEKGERIMPHKRSGCLIGGGLAKNLNIDTGDTVSLISNTVEGAINAINVEIVGILNTGVPQVDNLILYIPINAAQELLNVEGQVSNITILLKDISLVDKVADDIKKRLEGRFHDIDIVTWEQLATLFKRIQGMYLFQARIVEMIMFFLITLVICTVMIMAVFERTREIGTMSAFGIRRGEIISLFLCESIIIGMIGGVIGIILGIIINIIANIIGIPFNPPDTEIVVYIRPILIYDNVIFILIFAVLTTIIGGLYPAAWASKIKPSEAFRFI